MNRRDYDPMEGMLTLREAMNRLLEDSFVAGGAAGGAPASVGSLQMPLDVYETGDALIVRASLPGIQPEDIDITVTGDTLTIRGQLHDTAPTGAARHHQREHRFGVVARSLTLPVEVQSDRVEATFEHGVLVLTMPKAARLQPKTIRINTRGGATALSTGSGRSAASGQPPAQAASMSTSTQPAASGEASEQPAADQPAAAQPTADQTTSTGRRRTQKGSAGSAATRTETSTSSAAGPSDESADAVPSPG